MVLGFSRELAECLGSRLPFALRRTYKHVHLRVDFQDADVTSLLWPSWLMMNAPQTSDFEHQEVKRVVQVISKNHDKSLTVSECSCLTGRHWTNIPKYPIGWQGAQIRGSALLSVP